MSALRRPIPILWRCTLLWLYVLTATPGAAQSNAPVNTPTPAATVEQTAPPAIPLPDVVARREETLATVAALQQRLGKNWTLDDVESKLRAVSQRAETLAASTGPVLQGTPSAKQLDQLAASWQALKDDATTVNEALVRHFVVLDSDLQELSALRASWEAARETAKGANVPGIVHRIDATLAAIDDGQQLVDRRRGEILGLEDHAASVLQRCSAAGAQIAAAQRAQVKLLLVRNSEPLWSRAGRRQAWSEIPGSVAASLREEAQLLGEYLVGQEPRLGFQLLLYLFLLVVFLRARATLAARLADDDSLARMRIVLEQPISSAIVLGTVAGLWIYPEPPMVLRQLLGILTLVPILRILLRLIEAPLHPALSALAGLFVVDRLRGLISAVTLVDQLLLLLEMLAGGLLCGALVRRRHSAQLQRSSAGRLPLRTLDLGVRALLLSFTVSFCSALLGYLRLARFVESTVLNATYLGIALYALVRVAEGLVAYLLRAWPLNLLRMVRRYRARWERRINGALRALAVLTWGARVLSELYVLDAIVAAGQAVLATRFARGAVSLSVGDVVAFVFTVWLSFVLSRFARFVLEEDVYPRVQLPRGLPYAISNLLHYSVLLVGFLLALALMGVDLNRFTILVGAFGVGIGFGMQNVINNFLSGLILLFERPVQVGDTVQIGDLLGDIHRIGIRSSTIRTWEGAEVIVPNGNLTSDLVTNWTLSDRMRRIDLQIGVAYGSDPGQVLELLSAVAKQQPRILGEPPPSALFLGFGDSSLDFQLRVWTDQFEQWMSIRSDLGVAVHSALQAAGITIPFPQRDVHLDAAEPVAVRVVDATQDVAPTRDGASGRAAKPGESPRAPDRRDDASSD